MDAKTLRKMIASGQIETFAELVSYTGMKKMSEIMGCSVKHVRRVINEPGRMYYGEYFKFCEWLGMGQEEVSNLFVD